MYIVENSHRAWHMFFTAKFQFEIHWIIYQNLFHLSPKKFQFVREKRLDAVAADNGDRKKTVSNFNAVLIRFVTWIRSSLLVKIQWKQHHSYKLRLFTILFMTHSKVQLFAIFSPTFKISFKRLKCAVKMQRLKFLFP